MTVTDVKPIITSRFGQLDGHTIAGYTATGGYYALRKALDMAPAAVHDEVRTASLLGRGGAGFPAGVKWGFCPPDVWPRYLVVNGDESEPGTYKDRMLLERDPHQLIEGIARTTPEAEALLAPERPPLTYAGLLELVSRTVCQLGSLGLGTGDRVAVA